MLTLFEINLLKRIPLKLYLNHYILPLYDKFDKAHDRNHAIMVAEFAIKLSNKLKLDSDIAYAAALLHDIGLTIDRETHHIESGKFVNDSGFLKLLFNYDDIEVIRHAVEDHRASSGNVPRNIYGKIVADSDRCDFVKLENFMVRTWKFRQSVQHSMSDKELFEEIYNQAIIRFGKNGTVKFILPETTQLLIDDFNRTKQIIKDKSKTYDIFLKLRQEGILKRETE